MTENIPLRIWAATEADARRRGEEWARAEPKIAAWEITAAERIDATSPLRNPWEGPWRVDVRCTFEEAPEPLSLWDVA